MKIILQSIVILLLFASCKKIFTSNSTITISGHLYKNCNREVVPNRLLQLYQQRSGFNQGGIEVVGQDSTDANGYFSIKLPHTAKRLTLRIDGVGGEIMYEIPGKNNIENLDVFFGAKSIVQVSLNVINPKTNLDTLVLPNFKTNKVMRIPGPFTSGVLYTDTSFTTLGMYYGGAHKRLTWYYNTYQGTYFDKYFLVDKYCTGDTIKVAADIQ